MVRECQTEAKALKMRPLEPTLMKNNTRVLFMEDICCLEREGVLDRRTCARSQCIRSQGVRLIARNCSEFPRHGELVMEARATRETQVHIECTRSLLIRSITQTLDHRFLRLEYRNAQTCLWLLTRSALDRTRCTRSHCQDPFS